jgi:uncharacterized protein
MHSALYVGTVQHRRYAPKKNAFRYRLMYAYLDLDELDVAFNGRWLWSSHRWAPIRFDRRDYLAPTDRPLKDVALATVEAGLGRRPAGPVRLLTHLRHFGYCFNPVSFYYVYDGDRLDAIVAEITNTPWGERHRYVLDVTAAPKEGAVAQFRFAKDFHVSPFLPMNVDYDWRFSAPAEALHVHMTDRIDGAAVFDATLALRRQSITGTHLARALLSFPLMTIKVIVLIHWQALRLWIQRVPFYSHPER